MSQFEQRANVKFMCRLGKSASETLSSLHQVYGDTALKKSTVYYWFSRFMKGQEMLEDDQCSGRPSTSTTEEMVEKVWQLIQCDWRMTIVDGSHSEWLLAVPYPKNGPQGEAFRNHGRHQIKCDGQTLEDSKRSFPPVLPTIAGSMEQVCMCARVLLWRWLGKRYYIPYRYSAMLQFCKLFDCPSYYFELEEIQSFSTS